MVNAAVPGKPGSRRRCCGFDATVCCVDYFPSTAMRRKSISTCITRCISNARVTCSKTRECSWKPSTSLRLRRQEKNPLPTSLKLEERRTKQYESERLPGVKSESLRAFRDSAPVSNKCVRQLRLSARMLHMNSYSSCKRLLPALQT